MFHEFKELHIPLDALVSVIAAKVIWKISIQNYYMEYNNNIKNYSRHTNISDSGVFRVLK